MSQEDILNQIIQDVGCVPTVSFKERILHIAQYFLGKPYAFEPLGEGESGLYSTLPLYRADQFDCVTYVDTVLALANAADFAQFTKNMLNIRYADSIVDYAKRTDWFTDLEWNPHLQQLGYIADVTSAFVDQEGQPVARLAKAIINKSAWYAKKVVANLVLPGLSAADVQQRLRQLIAEGQRFHAQESTLSYIPLSCLVDGNGPVNRFMWEQLPDVAVIEIVRPNWRPINRQDNTTDYGTNLNVSHLGLAIRTEEGVMFYHASIAGSVMSGLLSDYLMGFLEDKRPNPVDGIHVEKVIVPLFVHR